VTEYPPCEHPYDGWFVDGVPIYKAGFLVSNFVESSPPRRGTDLTVARRTGQKYRQKFYDARTQTILLWALKEDEFGNVAGGAERNVDRLKRLFGGGLRQVELVRRLSLPFGRVSTRAAQVELVDALQGQRTVMTQTGTYVQFALDVRFADPFWYEPENIIEDAGAEDYGTFIAWNPGTVASEKAILRIYGPAVNPSVSAEPAGTLFSIDRSIEDGDWIEVDCLAFTVVDQDGVSVAGDLNRSQIPLLQVFPGRNEITLSEGTCDFRWRPAFL
jgi:hypothetical protein